MPSCGSWSSTARATVSPPTPESKMPIGLSLIGIMTPCCVPISQVRLTARADAPRFHAGDPTHTANGPLPAREGGRSCPLLGPELALEPGAGLLEGAAVG